MGGRYWITGVQLGMLIALIENINFNKARDLIQEIIDKQYLCEKEEFEKRK